MKMKFAAATALASSLLILRSQQAFHLFQVI
jgi:hypothetical protein